MSHIDDATKLKYFDELYRQSRRIANCLDTLLSGDAAGLAPNSGFRLGFATAYVELGKTLKAIEEARR